MEPEFRADDEVGPIAPTPAEKPSGFFGVAGAEALLAVLDERALLAGAERLVRASGLAVYAFLQTSGSVDWLQNDEVACVVGGEVYGDAGAGNLAKASLLATAYADRSAAAWSKLDGLFAVVLWDVRRGELLLYRDRSAAAGLFYMILPNGGLVFADKLSQLAILVPGKPWRVGNDSLHEYLRFLDVSPPRTIFDGVFALEPDTLLHHFGEKHEIQRAPPQPPVTSSVPGGLRNALDGFESAFATAVANRIPERGRFASFLSGGVDSALVCAVCRELGENRVDAFTVGFDDSVRDESANAVQIAKYLGIAHHVLRLSLDDYHAAFPFWVASLEFPYGDPAGLPPFLAYATVKKA